MLAPTPGARNLLKHMVKEDTRKKVESGAVRSVSAKELLAMTHQKMAAIRKQVGVHHSWHSSDSYCVYANLLFLEFSFDE